MVIGGNGSGKSVFSNMLANLLEVPCVHLDTMFRNPDHTLRVREVVNEELRTLYQSAEWVIDGNYSDTWAERSRTADLIILLDIGKENRIRNIEQRSKTGSSIDDGSMIVPNEEFMRYALGYEENGGQKKAIDFVQSNAAKAVTLHEWDECVVKQIADALRRGPEATRALCQAHAQGAPDHVH